MLEAVGTFSLVFDAIIVMYGRNNVVNGRCSINHSDLELTLSKTLNKKVMLVCLSPRHDNPYLNPTVASVNEKLFFSKHKHVIFLSLDTIPRFFFHK